jgi:hypothetical protein
LLLAFLFFPPELLPPQFVSVTDDHRRMFEIIKKSGLDWVAVFPPHIADLPATNGDYEVQFKQNGSYNLIMLIIQFVIGEPRG